MDKQSPQIIIFADGEVGYRLVRWLLDYHPDDVALVVVIAKNRIFELLEQRGTNCLLHSEFNTQKCQQFFGESGPDLGLLLWWPKILKEDLLNWPRYGFINTHPSLLPHARGKHYNFWTLVEAAPFGVSLHFTKKDVDAGEIVAQKPIDYGWEDTGESLYYKALDAMYELFVETFSRLRVFDFKAYEQNLDEGSFHFAFELDQACKIKLDESYTVRNLLNLLRARTFSGHPACNFEDDGKRYEVRVEIKSINDE
jgi:methionyl-tRNA formyltransferase